MHPEQCYCLAQVDPKLDLLHVTLRFPSVSWRAWEGEGHWSVAAKSHHLCLFLLWLWVSFLPV